MANIGNLSIVVSANAAQATAGLDAAAASVHKLGNAAAQADQAASRSATSIARGAASSANEMLQATHGLLSAIPLIGGALAAIPLSGVAFVDFLKEGMEHIRQMTFLANELGVSTQALGGIMVLAGVHGEAMEKGIFKLNEQLGEAAAGSLEVQDKFTGLGINWRQLAEASGETRLGLVMDRLHGIADSSERARVATGLFAKAGRELAPILAQGSGALAKAEEEAKVLGLSFSQEAAEGAIKAAAAMRTVHHVVEGLKTQLTIAAGPILEKFLNPEAVAAFLKDMGGIPGIVTKVGDTVIPVLASIIDALETMAALAKKVGDQFTLFHVKKGSVAEKISNFFSGKKPQEGASGAAGEAAANLSIGDKVKEVWKNTKAEMVSPGDGKAAPKEAIDAGLIEKMNTLAKHYERLADTAGMSSREIEVHNNRLQAISPAAKEAADKLRDLDIALTKQENEDKRQQDAQAIAEQTESAYDKFEDQLQRINSLKREGLLTDEEAALAIQKQTEELRSSMKEKMVSQGELAKNIDFGSGAYNDLVNHYQSQLAGDDPQKATAELLRTAKEQRDVQIDLARKLVDALDQVQEVDF